MNHKLLFATVCGITALVAAAPAQAQQSQIKTNAIQKSNFFQAPRRIQIIDERPIISDFREGPQAVGSIQLPPPPAGFGGAGGGQGGGALPNGGGGMATPVAQLPAGPGMLPYRTPFDPQGALPKVGFGRFSNIPARGMGPRTALPNGVSTGVHAQMAPLPPRSSTQSPLNHPQAIASNPRAATPIASYGGPAYTSVPASARSNVSGTVVNTALRGQLLTRLQRM